MRRPVLRQITLLSAFSLLLLFAGFAAAAEGDKPVPQWLWASKSPKVNETILLRKTFEVKPGLASASLAVTVTSPSASRARSIRLIWPESTPSRDRSATTSPPSVPISHRSRDTASGRAVDRKSSLSAPTRSLCAFPVAQRAHAVAERLPGR